MISHIKLIYRANLDMNIDLSYDFIDSIVRMLLRNDIRSLEAKST